MASLNNLCKSEHRRVFLSMQGDAKTFPGGITGLSEQLGINKTTLANQLNPDHDAAPPTMGTVIEIIVLTSGSRTLIALCSLGNYVPFEMVVQERTPAEAVSMFLKFVQAASTTIGDGSSFAADGKFDAGERQKLEEFLLNTIRSASELLNALRL